MEIKVLNDTANTISYLIAIASPKEKSNKIWNELYKIQKAVSFYL